MVRNAELRYPVVLLDELVIAGLRVEFKEDVEGHNPQRTQQVNECIVLDVAGFGATRYLAGRQDGESSTLGGSIDHVTVDGAVEYVVRHPEQWTRDDHIIH